MVRNLLSYHANDLRKTSLLVDLFNGIKYKYSANSHANPSYTVLIQISVMNLTFSVKMFNQTRRAFHINSVNRTVQCRSAKIHSFKIFYFNWSCISKKCHQ